MGLSEATSHPRPTLLIIWCPRPCPTPRLCVRVSQPGVRRAPSLARARPALHAPDTCRHRPLRRRPGNTLSAAPAAHTRHPRQLRHTPATLWTPHYSYTPATLKIATTLQPHYAWPQHTTASCQPHYVHNHTTATLCRVPAHYSLHDSHTTPLIQTIPSHTMHSPATSKPHYSLTTATSPLHHHVTATSQPHHSNTRAT